MIGVMYYMNRPIDIEIFDAKQKIVAVLNGSPLPSCIMQMVLSEVLDSVSQAAVLEYQKHSAELAGAAKEGQEG